MIYDQFEFDIRCEWGLQGLQQLAPISDAVIIVDVLSFSTCVEIATSNHAIVYPYRYKDESATAYAESLQAELAGKRGSRKYNLSPQSLLKIPPQTKLVLPSPNGSTLSLHTSNTNTKNTSNIMTVAGCLRNCQAVAEYVQTNIILKNISNFNPDHFKIAVIPAGEIWEDGSLRPALEDWIGAGAIINYLSGMRSPEALTAEIIFNHHQQNLLETLQNIASGKELIQRGFQSDVEIASQLNISNCVPLLKNQAYTAAETNNSTNITKSS